LEKEKVSTCTFCKNVLMASGVFELPLPKNAQKRTKKNQEKTVGR
jgi:hypothetical protein